jgi:hypothetical protein
VIKVGRLQVRFQVASFEFFIDIILGLYYGPGVGSASNRKGHQEYSMWGEDGQCVGLTLPLSCAKFLEIGEPQPPGTLRACNWIALNVSCRWTKMSQLICYWIRHFLL